MTTCVGAASRLLKGVVFDVVVVDEAAQALEAACWIPILKGRRCVLAGDHLQLPPVVVTPGDGGLNVTLFERAMSAVGGLMLREQFRMHSKICGWASEAMYGGGLITACDDGDREKEGLPTLVLVDTKGCGMGEAEDEDGSRLNRGEAEVVGDHVGWLVGMGMAEEDIGVITPYNGQVSLIKAALKESRPGVAVRTVDGFQGGEKEAIVLSLVRSNAGREVGFLREKRRLNVAFTRAKRHVFVVCDSETVCSDTFLKGLVDYMEENGEVRSALPEHGAEDDRGRREAERAMVEAVMKSVEKGPGNNGKQQPQGGGTKKKKQPEAAKKPAAGAPPDAKELLNSIQGFYESAEGGAEMRMGKELGAKERALVHEMCEQLGLLHRSEGEGADRVIIVGKQKKTVQGGGGEAEGDAEADNVDKGIGFAQLSVEDGDDDDDGDEDDEGGRHDGGDGNALLRQLAEERRLRREAKEEGASEEPPPPPAAKKKKKKKKKNKEKAETTMRDKQNAKNGQIELPDVGGDDDDDMAFLDAMVAQTQASHGRKVEGTGKGYKR